MKNLYIIKDLIWSKNKTMSDRNKQVKKKQMSWMKILPLFQTVITLILSA
jgi:hypothetical protein